METKVIEAGKIHEEVEALKKAGYRL
ncbi:MAG: hypothetical protein UX72_C0047G0014, partial [Parcubacteria group bacterium GW2011_GWA2_47_10]